MMKRFSLVGAVLFYVTSASPHDLWADGTEVPAWVKAACCGPADAHLLTPSDITLESDGYHIRGYPYVVPFKDALPSLDGQYWIFYGTNWPTFGGEAPSVTHPYCFFAPVGAGLVPGDGNGKMRRS